MTFTFRSVGDSDKELFEEWFEDQETLRWLDFPGVTLIPNQHRWLVYEKNIPIGEITIEEYEDQTGSILVLVNPKLRNQGYGSKILTYALKRKEISHLHTVSAYISPNNPASYHCFLKAKFVDQGIEEDGMKVLSYDMKKART